MAAGKHGDEHVANHVLLPDNDFSHLGLDTGERVAKSFCVHGVPSLGRDVNDLVGPRGNCGRRCVELLCRKFPRPDLCALGVRQTSVDQSYEALNLVWPVAQGIQRLFDLDGVLA